MLTFLIVHLPVDGSSNAQENLKHLVLKYGARALSLSPQIKGVQELGTSMFVSININEHGGEWANLLYLFHPCRCKTKDLWIADISNKTCCWNGVKLLSWEYLFPARMLKPHLVRVQWTTMSLLCVQEYKTGAACRGREWVCLDVCLLEDK